MSSDPYFTRSEVSNSILSALDKLLKGDFSPPPTAAYNFGTLLDALVTEPEKVNHLNRSVEDLKFTDKDFQTAIKMQRSFMGNTLALSLYNQSEFQVVSVCLLEITFRGFTFDLAARCKWDGLIRKFKKGWDLKSTIATTQEQFNELVEYFNYDRQSAWYMDLEKTDTHILIGVSKKNFKVFHKIIKRDSDLYLSGKDKYSELAFKYYSLIEGYD